MLTEKEVREKVKSRYQCRTVVKGGPKPHLIDDKDYGHHDSYVEGGYRIWGFVSIKGRDKFARLYGAEQCQV